MAIDFKCIYKQYDISPFFNSLFGDRYHIYLHIERSSKQKKLVSKRHEKLKKNVSYDIQTQYAPILLAEAKGKLQRLPSGFKAHIDTW